MKLAFIGLGVMGYPMAGHLKRAGHDVTVFNRTEARARKWAEEHGGAFAATPGEAARGAVQRQEDLPHRTAAALLELMA